jgi:CHRD domain
MLRSTLLAAVFAAGFATAASAAMLQFHATMNGASEVPPKQTAGTGEALATLDTAKKQLNYTVSFENLSGPATAAHFHGPAAAGKNAGVAVPIGGASPTSPVHGTATLTDAQIKDLEAGMWYVNVHTAANPGGEIRGQVLPVK